VLQKFDRFRGLHVRKFNVHSKEILCIGLWLQVHNTYDDVEIHNDNVYTENFDHVHEYDDTECYNDDRYDDEND
jgi:hypothetical protein